MKASINPKASSSVVNEITARVTESAARDEHGNRQQLVQLGFGWDEETAEIRRGDQAMSSLMANLTPHEALKFADELMCIAESLIKGRG